MRICCFDLKKWLEHLGQTYISFEWFFTFSMDSERQHFMILFEMKCDKLFDIEIRHLIFGYIFLQEIARKELNNLVEQHQNLDEEIKELESKSTNLKGLYKEQEDLLSKVSKSILSLLL